ncbi:MAG: MgtC/SapB family protein [Myxococcota bacterium]
MATPILTPGDIQHALLKLLLAYALALPIGWLRESRGSTAGLRTFPLVAVASCGYTLLGIAVSGTNADAEARVLAGLMTGMGFIGGGAIVKDERAVHGSSTAAAIWSTGVVGASVAYEQTYVALAVVAITALTFLVLTPIARRLRRAVPEGQEAPEPSSRGPSDPR